MDRQELIQALDSLSGSELEGLISSLEDAWQIKRPNMGVQGPQLQKVIKKLRELLGLQLKEAKEFAESVPKIMKEGIEQSEVDAIKEAFKESEAVLTVK
jgi:ribosomal protein L7/L12